MRLDKLLCDMGIGTRSQVKAFVRQGLVTVNGSVALAADMKIDASADKIRFRGKPLQYCRYVYYMLNKPQGVVSATTDNRDRTVVSLLGGRGREGVFPVGRLDKDATGLLLLTDDGELAHRLLSPRRHVDKTYRVLLEHPLAKEDAKRLEQGVDIGEEGLTLPAGVEVLDGNSILLTLHEGKYHQVKRMLSAVGNRVLALERISFGGVCLDEGLQPGEYRELTGEEIASLKAVCGAKEGGT